MADSEKQQKHLLRLPLEVKVSGSGTVTTDGLKAIAEKLRNDICMFHRQTAACEEMKHISIRDVQFTDSQIYLIFQILNEEHLIELYGKLKSANNALSQCITEFSSIHEWELHANLGLEKRLEYKAVLPRKLFSEHLLLYEQDDNKESSVQAETINKDTIISKDNIESLGKNTLTAPCDLKTASRSHENTKILKCFMVVFQSASACVNIKSNCMKEINCSLTLHVNFADYSIYKVSLLLPSCLDEETTFWYEFKCDNYVYLGWLKRETIKNTAQLIIRNCPVQRDIISEHCFYGHLYDIVFHCSKETDLCELCLQVEDVCRSEWRVHIIDIGILRLSKIVFTKNKKNNEIIMFGIIIGYLQCHLKLNMLHHLRNDQNLGSCIIKALQGIQLTELPSSCSSYMPLLFQQLCSLFLAKGHCKVVELNLLYPFVGEHVLNDALTSYIDSKGILATLDGESKQHSLELCQKLYKMSLTDENKTEACKNILAQLLMQLPLEVTLYVLGYLQQKQTDKPSHQETDLQSALNECLAISLQPILHTIKESGDLSMLMIQAKHIQASHVVLNDSLKDLIEKCVVNAVAAGCIKVKNDFVLERCIKMLHGDLHCFTALSSQHEFIKTCAGCSNSVALDSVITLFNYKPFQPAYSSLGQETYQVCLQNMMKNHGNTQDDSLVFMLETITSLRNITGSMNSADVTRVLEEVARQEFIKYPVTTLIRKWQTFEDVHYQRVIVCDICTRYFQEQISKPNENTLEILQCLCGVGRVHLRTTAKLIGVFIDCKCKKPENGTVFEQFLKILPDAMFWQTIWKGSGRTFYEVKENEMYCHVNKCITHVSKVFKLKEVTLDFLEKCKDLQHNANILLMLGGLSQKEINDILAHVDKLVLAERNKIMTVSNVLHKLSTRVTDVHGISKLIKCIADIEKTLQSITVSEYFDKKQIWTDIQDLPSYCDALQMLISSEVFWNICGDKVKSSYIEYMNNKVCKVTSQEILDSAEISHGLFFIKTLHDDGIALYKCAWFKLQNDNTYSMKYVMMSFNKVNVSEEINTAEKFLLNKIDELTKITLSKLEDKYIIQKKLNAIRSILEVFGYNITNDQKLYCVIELFEKLITGDISEFTFSDVKLCLQTLCDIANQLSDVTVDIMVEISKSSQLLEFLRTIVDDDLRNPIDAVKDISEQCVSETTISALIDVKRFFSPFLNFVPGSENDRKWLFDTLEQQAKAMDEKAIDLIAKVSDCMSNLHNLKSWYCNVTKGVELTKEVLSNVVDSDSCDTGY